jgi:ribosomal protein L25 (general stress protein Ctc)
MSHCRVIIVLSFVTFINGFTYDRDSPDLYLGDNCVLINGQPGVCEEFTKCDYAKQLYQLRKQSEIKVCRYNGNVPIVCCASSQKSTGIKRSSKKFQNALCKNAKPTLKIDNHIINGMKADVGEFPFQAVLGYRNGRSIDFRCGGSLIADDIILTAAHCVSRTDDMPILVRLGRVRLICCWIFMIRVGRAPGAPKKKFFMNFFDFLVVCSFRLEE